MFVGKLKIATTNEKACDFIISTETPSNNMTFKKVRNSKAHIDQNFCQFMFFQCDVFFDKLSKLG